MKGLLLSLPLALLTVCACQEARSPLDGSDALNLPPVMHVQSDTSVALGDTLRLLAVADDPDGDEVTYRLTTRVTWMEVKEGRLPDAHIEATTGGFYFRPQWYDRPSRTFTFHAEDDLGAADSTTFSAAVNE